MTIKNDAFYIGKVRGIFFFTIRIACAVKCLNQCHVDWGLNTILDPFPVTLAMSVVGSDSIQK